MKFKFIHIFIVVSSILIIKLLTGCGDVISSDANLIFPDSLISYISNVEPFMRVKCSYIGCHCDPPYNYSASTMTNYFSLFSTDNLGLVISGKPDNSRLIQIMDGRLPHNPYFQTGYITQNQINGMRKWIEEGAKNN